MKFTIEVDCTPEEARSFFGLPDVKPMQEAAMARISQQMADAVSQMTPEAVFRTWLPMAPWTSGASWTPGAMQDAMSSLFGAAFTPKKPENS